jgi:NAD(P)-dependent dehydrogenase (short-subunit alcohol dehydrogenase family)
MTTHDKVAVITGGGTGIGKACALAFVKDGYRVVISGRRPEPLDETIKEAGVDSQRMIGVPTDVGDPAAVKNLFAKTTAACCLKTCPGKNGKPWWMPTSMACSCARRKPTKS